MQYFIALKIGEKRVKDAQDILSKFLDSNTPALPSLALKDNKNNNWEPVGDENYFAVAKEEQGYIIVICDKNGIAKSIANWFTEEKKEKIVNNIRSEGRLEQYFGKLSLPV